MSSIEGYKGKWQQQVGAAKITWGKLTNDELLETKGHEQKLAGLIQERYAISREVAEEQIKDFFNKQKS
ncbi:CsbD family protein [Thioploca ingrica]|uniref:CsbD family protein n=1 Tax=Thioploca ingrica TaxID=40754 RepID=A0A090AJC6_9GAMM|nr:CsbD family protein [Thioploca ingrica]